MWEYVIDIIEAISGSAVAANLIITWRQIKADKAIRKREEEISQAQYIAAWRDSSTNRRKGPDGSNCCYSPTVLQNSSTLPVYEVIVSCVGQYGAGPAMHGQDNDGNCFEWRTQVSLLPPGKWLVWLPTCGNGMGVVTSVEIAFVDAAGRSWVRRGNGSLESLSEIPITFFSVTQPCAWESITRYE